MNNHEQITIEDVLNDYTAFSSTPNKEALVEWIRRHPQYERELTEFTASWVLMDKLPSSPSRAAVSKDTLVLRGMSVVQNLLHQKKQSTSTSDEKPLASILNVAKGYNLSISDLAELCALSIPMISKFERRLIRFASIPHEAIEVLAGAIRHSVASVTQYLQGQAKASPLASYRSEQQPSTGEQQDFFDAVRTDLTMSEERRQRWLALESRNK